jgi:hypothetical protein
MLALDHDQRIQHVQVQHVPGTDMLLYHIEAGLFDIHVLDSVALTKNQHFIKAAPQIWY